jgi:hypothetical protein
MKSAIVLFAGTLLASAALQAAEVRYSEELYRAKYRWSLPAKASQPTLKKEPAKPAPTCCLSLQGQNHVAKSAGASRLDDYFRAKLGRSSPADEARLTALTHELAAHRPGAQENATCEHACCR